jgi:hypothetical protein
VPWFTLAAALLLLNFALSFHNIWPTLWITHRYEVSLELVLLLPALLLHRRLLGPPPPRLLTVLAALMTLLTVGRYADVTAPALYGRPINLYWDAQHMPAVLTMIGRAAPPWQVASAVTALVLLLLALATGLRWCIGRLSVALDSAGECRVLGVLAGGLTLLYLAGIASPRLATEHWFSLPVSPLYLRQASFVADALWERARPESLPRQELPDSDLVAVADADVVIIFLESYGATAYDNPSHAAGISIAHRALMSAVTASGRQAASTFVRSPTFGGASWLAHASLLSGIEVADPEHYALLLTQRRDTLVHRFAQQGYRPVAIMPGLRQHWPEGGYYGFDDIYGADALGYLGPDFGFWRIPDQYALAKLNQQELGPLPRAPRFVFFPTITSHLPFRPTPPYQPNWKRLLTADAFDPGVHRQAIDLKPDLSHLGPAYVDVLNYAFRTLAGYLQRRAVADQFLIVLGDHQPAASVSGEGATWEVPVHVISNRGGLVARLLEAGFDPGMTPRRPGYGAMHELTGLLLRVFDSSSGGVAASAAVRLEDRVHVAGRRLDGQVLEPSAHGLRIQPAGVVQPMTLAD